jgi:hypothetical protein
VSDGSGCLMGHGDVLLVLLSPRSSSERFGAGARPVHPIRVGSRQCGNTAGGVDQTCRGHRSTDVNDPTSDIGRPRQLTGCKIAPLFVTDPRANSTRAALFDQISLLHPTARCPAVVGNAGRLSLVLRPRHCGRCDRTYVPKSLSGNGGIAISARLRP